MISMNDLEARIQNFRNAGDKLASGINSFDAPVGDEERQQKFDHFKKAAIAAIGEAETATDEFKDEVTAVAALQG